VQSCAGSSSPLGRSASLSSGACCRRSLRRCATVRVASRCDAHAQLGRTPPTLLLGGHVRTCADGAGTVVRDSTHEQPRAQTELALSYATPLTNNRTELALSYATPLTNNQTELALSYATPLTNRRSWHCRTRLHSRTTTYSVKFKGLIICTRTYASVYRAKVHAFGVSGVKRWAYVLGGPNTIKEARKKSQS
jgi:hypothetical protein